MAIVATETISGGPFDSTSVVETVNGFPRGDKAVDAAFVASMIACFITDGVLHGEDGEFEVSAGGDMSVNVKPGTAWAEGYMAKSEEELTFELSPGHEYKVFVRLNKAQGEAAVILYEDDAGWLPIRSHAICDLVLAVIDVPEGATALESSMISDVREDSDVCGYVTSRL